MKFNNLIMSSTKAFALVDNSYPVTQALQDGWDVRFDYLLVPPLVDPVLVTIPGYQILVHNGSNSTIKVPVAGAFSKWNKLEWLTTVFSTPVVGVDRFVISYKLDELGWDYTFLDPLHIGSSFIYFKTGTYNPEERQGIAWRDFTSTPQFCDDENFDGRVSLDKTNAIQECPEFSLPKRIQLRIALIRVKEN
jgi:hypothetical protein